MLILFTGSAAAQPAPPPLDPLIQLMAAQPPIEIATNIEVKAAFDPPVILSGEQAIYRVTFNALDDSVRWPERIIAPPQLEFRLSARGQMVVPAGAKLQPKTAINYHVRASAAGTYVIPEFAVQVYDRRAIVPAARLEVVLYSAANIPPPARLDLEVAGTNVYIGQRLKTRVLMPAAAANTIEALANVRLNGDGFLVDQNAARQTINMMPRNGRSVATYMYETALTPLVTGQLAVSAQGFTAGNQFGLSGPITIQGQVVIPGGPPQYLLLDSDPVTINVRPLPRSGELPGFAGAIGKLTCDPPQLSTNQARVGDLVKLTVTFRGGEDLVRLVAPPPPAQGNWQMFDPVPGGAPAPTAGANPPPPGSAATFTYTLIPLTDEVRATPAIPFSSFDPERGAYVDLTIPSVPIKVTPGAAKADSQAWPAAYQSSATEEKKPALSALAPVPGRAADSLVPLQQRGWFVVVQLLPLAGFAGLWFWDRRRRFLEQHPEVELRRRARHALRCERRFLQKAFQSGNAPRFAAVAVKALRVACAPHYPAEPRALVCGDVLAVLGDAERAGRGGDAVRRCFATSDAAEFSGAGAEAGGLLALQPELERVLDELEAKL